MKFGKKDAQEVWDAYMKDWAATLHLKGDFVATLAQWEEALRDPVLWAAARVKLLSMILAVRARQRKVILGRCGGYAPTEKHAILVTDPDPVSIHLLKEKGLVPSRVPAAGTAKDRMLASIKEDGVTTSTKLSKKCRVSKPKTCRHLLTLCKWGLAERIPVPSPHRGEPRFQYRAVA